MTEQPAGSARGEDERRPGVRLPLHRSAPPAPTKSRATPRWMRELKKSITKVSELERLVELTDSERRGARRAESEGLPLRITPHILKILDRHDPTCPVRRQCIPVQDEALDAPGDMLDPLGELEHEVAPHLVQRYPDRALLLVTDRCALYCRFCTRSRMVGDGGGAISLERLRPALDYLRAHPEVRDVIVSGGDPLTLSTERLVRVVRELRSIPSLVTIRLASRVPVTLPSRITRELLRALRPFHPLFVMTHFNHPKELQAASIAACARLADHGFPVLNQTVLMKRINDRKDTLAQLFRGLTAARVRPYYLLQMDPVRGSSHFRTPSHVGAALMAELQGQLSGICLPKFIVDTPGGRGKVPVSESYVVERGPTYTRYRSPFGGFVDYPEPDESE